MVFLRLVAYLAMELRLNYFDQVKCRELSEACDSVRDGYCSDFSFLTNDDVVVDGSFCLSKLRSGIIVHATDTVERHTMTLDFERLPCISIFLILEGGINFSAAGRKFHFGDLKSDQGHTIADGRIISFNENTLLQRHSIQGCRTRKVSISIDPLWLFDSITDNHQNKSRILQLTQQHLATSRWQPSLHSIALAEEIINPPDMPDYIKSMYIECRAIELVINAFQGMSGTLNEQSCDQVEERQPQRIKAVRRYIDNNLQTPLNLATIAKHTGFSVSSLQRHFKETYGTTVVDYVRTRKLAEARNAIEQQGMSVGEAAYIAGYTNSSSFTTAFKRMFGLTPSSLLN